MTDTNLERRPVPEGAPIYATDAEDYVRRSHDTRRRLLAEELRQERGRVWLAMRILCEHIRNIDESGHEAIAGLAITSKHSTISRTRPSTASSCTSTAAQTSSCARPSSACGAGGRRAMPDDGLPLVRRMNALLAEKDLRIATAGGWLTATDPAWRDDWTRRKDALMAEIRAQSR